LNFRQGETGILCGDPDVGAEYKFHTRAGAEPLYGGYDRVVLLLPEAVDPLKPGQLLKHIGRAHTLQIVQVDTRRKALAVCVDDKTADPLLSGNMILDLSELHIEARFKYVVGRTVQSQDTYALFQRKEKVFSFKHELSSDYNNCSG
jgi:hypothetical protein